MRTPTLLLFALLLAGCEMKYPTKPFIIINKEQYYGTSQRYTYVGQNQETETFYDTVRYSIGDTIK